MKVDFIGIGAPKCATTWLSEQCASHPEISFAPLKEVYFFADSISRRYASAEHGYYERGENWYHRQFPQDKPMAKIRGEFTPAYFYSPEALDRIYNYNPNVRLVVCLRNPVDMLYSWYCHNKNGLIAELPETFEELIEINFFKQLGKYHSFLEPFSDKFGEDNIHVILHRDIKKNPIEILSKLFKFLNVSSNFTPHDFSKRVNKSTSTRFEFLQQLAHWHYRQLSKVTCAKKLLESRTFESFALAVYSKINRVKKDYKPIDLQTRFCLSKYYLHDIEKLEELISRDLRDWKPLK